MKMIAFQQGQSRGFDETVYLNPEEVSEVIPIYHHPESGSMDNRTAVIMKNGNRVLVKDSAYSVNLRLLQ